MPSIDYGEFTSDVCKALRSSFAELIAKNSRSDFYTFAIWTDDSLQFAYPAANTEQGLATTVRRYQEKHDPEYGTTSTLRSMRWSYGDWEFFPLENDEHFSPINQVLRENFEAEQSTFEQQLEPLWQSLIRGFWQLDQEGFFGAGESRLKVTLLIVGDLPEEITEPCATALNPPEVAQRYNNWNHEEADL